MMGLDKPMHTTCKLARKYALSLKNAETSMQAISSCEREAGLRLASTILREIMSDDENEILTDNRRCQIVDSEIRRASFSAVREMVTCNNFQFPRNLCKLIKSYKLRYETRNNVNEHLLIDPSTLKEQTEAMRFLQGLLLVFPEIVRTCIDEGMSDAILSTVRNAYFDMRRSNETTSEDSDCNSAILHTKACFDAIVVLSTVDMDSGIKNFIEKNVPMFFFGLFDTTTDDMSPPQSVVEDLYTYACRGFCMIADHIKELIANDLEDPVDNKFEIVDNGTNLHIILGTLSKQILKYGKDEKFSNLFREVCFGYIKDILLSRDETLNVEDLDS